MLIAALAAIVAIAVAGGTTALVCRSREPARPGAGAGPRVGRHAMVAPDPAGRCAQRHHRSPRRVLGVSAAAHAAREWLDRGRHRGRARQAQYQQPRADDASGKEERARLERLFAQRGIAQRNLDAIVGIGVDGSRGRQACRQSARHRLPSHCLRACGPSAWRNLPLRAASPRATCAQMKSFVVALPAATVLNVNTAPPEVLAAAIPGTVGRCACRARCRARPQAFRHPFRFSLAAAERRNRSQRDNARRRQQLFPGQRARASGRDARAGARGPSPRRTRLADRGLANPRVKPCRPGVDSHRPSRKLHRTEAPPTVDVHSSRTAECGARRPSRRHLGVVRRQRASRAVGTQRAGRVARSRAQGGRTRGGVCAHRGTAPATVARGPRRCGGGLCARRSTRRSRGRAARRRVAATLRRDGRGHRRQPRTRRGTRREFRSHPGRTSACATAGVAALALVCVRQAAGDSFASRMAPPLPPANSAASPTNWALPSIMPSEAAPAPRKSRWPLPSTKRPSLSLHNASTRPS